MEIYDNFLQEEDFQALSELMTSNIYWHYVDIPLARFDDVSVKRYARMFKDENRWMLDSEFAEFFDKCFSPLYEQCGTAYRIRSFRTHPTPKKIKSAWHWDDELKKLNVAIFYMTTNNGYTEWENGVRTGCVANRLVVADGDLKHRVVLNSNFDEVRSVINFNLLEEV